MEQLWEPALQGKGAGGGQGEPQVWAHPQLYPCHPHVTDTRPGVGCELGQPFGRAVSQFVFKCQKGSPFDSAFLLLGTSAKEVFHRCHGRPRCACGVGYTTQARRRGWNRQRPGRWHHQPPLKVGISVCGHGQMPVICFGMNRVSHPRANICFSMWDRCLCVLCTCVCVCAHVCV